MKKLLLFLLSALILVSCDNFGTSEAEKDIRLETGALKEYTVYADETSVNAGKGISFTTTGSWLSAVIEITDSADNLEAASPAWIKLSPDHGDEAGDYTVVVTLEENVSGKERKAVITLLSGKTSIAITVLQKGIKKSEEKPGEDFIKLVSGTAEEYSVSAASQTISGIAFTTSGAWNLMEGVDWIKVTPDHGDTAGEYSLEITLAKNSSDRGRKALLTFSCGKERLTITVNQSAESGNDGNIKYVSSIKQSVDVWSGYDEKWFEDYLYEFMYDADKRVTEYAVTDNDSWSQSVYTSRLSYEDNLIKVVRTDHDGEEDYTTITLNSAGYADKIELSDPHSDSYSLYFAYDDDQRLSKLTWTEYGTNYRCDYHYYTGADTGTVLSSVVYHDYHEPVTDLETMFGTIPNNTLNIDPNMLFMEGVIGGESIDDDDDTDRLDLAALLRLTGKGCDSYVEYIDTDQDEVAEPTYVFTEPNQTIHESRTYYKTDSDEKLTYVLGEDGSIQSIFYKERVVKILYEYDVIVGNEFLEPEYPEFGYKWKIANETRTNAGNGVNTYTYTFSYLE